MFEKEATEYEIKVFGTCETGKGIYTRKIHDTVYETFKQAATFGFNKANEWHYVKEEGTPKVEGHYLVCLQNKDHDILDCWILFDKDIGWYSLQVRLVDIYVWKKIVLPEFPKESKK